MCPPRQTHRYHPASAGGGCETSGAPAGDAVGISGGSIDPVPGCEGLVLDVSDLWHRVDEFLASVHE